MLMLYIDPVIAWHCVSSPLGMTDLVEPFYKPEHLCKHFHCYLKPVSSDFMLVS